jgi:alpha-glucosidase (family GH31 glycosyl hydrolase)
VSVSISTRKKAKKLFTETVTTELVADEASRHSVCAAILPGEHWWGGRVRDGLEMPLSEAAILQVNLNENGYNQASPFFVSDMGRFLWSDGPFVMTAESGELTCEGPRPIHLSEGHGTLRNAFLVARQLHFPPPQAIPDPLLFQAPQYNTWIELMYDQEETAILNYAERLIQEGYPPGVLMIDDNWQEAHGVWDFHSGRFCDPKGMVERLHGMGLKVMLWICPFVSPDTMTFRELRMNHALVLGEDRKPHLSDWWNGHSAVLDLTRDAGRQWFEGRLRFLMDTYGIDGFKFDAGDFSFYPRDAHAHCEAFNRLGATFPLNEYRAAWKCANLPLAQRLADRRHSWKKDGLASVLPNLLLQGLLGYPFVCPDMIGGGEYKSFLDDGFAVDAELVVRYAQAAALCPMMQFSAAPWRILDAKHSALCQEAALLHAKLGGEILELARGCAATGEPMLRSMEYQFPKRGYAAVSDQFVLGDSIVVAPVLTKGQTERIVRIPPGRWQDDRGEVFVGPQAVNMSAPIERLIWLRRLVM